MDCVADLLSQKGMEGTLAWCEAGLKLRCRSSAETSSWVVLGHLPEEEGNGKTVANTPTTTMESNMQSLYIQTAVFHLRSALLAVLLMTCGCNCARPWPRSEVNQQLCGQGSYRLQCCTKRVHGPTVTLNMQQVNQVWRVCRALGVPLFCRPLPTPLQ